MSKLLTDCADGSVLACFDAFLAAYAGIWSVDFNVLVKRQIHHTKDLPSTDQKTFPTGLALVRVKLYVSRLLWLPKTFTTDITMRHCMECRHHGKSSHADKVQGHKSVATTDMEQDSAHYCRSQCSRHYYCLCLHLFIRLEFDGKGTAK